MARYTRRKVNEETFHWVAHWVRTKHDTALIRVLISELQRFLRRMVICTGDDGSKATVRATDDGFTWSIDVTFESLINEYITVAYESCEPHRLEAFALLLEKSARKARRWQAYLDEVPAPGTASG